MCSCDIFSVLVRGPTPNRNAQEGREPAPPPRLPKEKNGTNRQRPPATKETSAVMHRVAITIGKCAAVRIHTPVGTVVNCRKGRKENKGRPKKGWREQKKSRMLSVDISL